MKFIATTIITTLIYLLLTAGSGKVGYLWSGEELRLAIAIGLIAGIASRKFFCGEQVARFFNPLRWLWGLLYVLGPFFVELAKANYDVAYRVITGKIRPGIVRVKSGMQTEMGVLMLSNSITLTPGTLTVGVDDATNDLFVHMINVPEGKETAEYIEAREVFSKMDCPAWIRRIVE